MCVSLDSKYVLCAVEGLEIRRVPVDNSHLRDALRAKVVKVRPKYFGKHGFWSSRATSTACICVP